MKLNGDGHSRVNLVIGDFRFGADSGGDFARGLGGAFERAAFGHVEDDLEFALVVERQHLHLHPADAHERHRAQQQAHDAGEEDPAPLALRDERAHEPAIEPREEILRMLRMRVRLARCLPSGARLQSGANTSCPSAECESRPTA